MAIIVAGALCCCNNDMPDSGVPEVYPDDSHEVLPPYNVDARKNSQATSEWSTYTAYTIDCLEGFTPGGMEPETDKYGNFTLQNIPEGNQTLIFSMLGREEVENFRRQVKEYFVPFATRIHEERRKRIGVEKLSYIDNEVYFKEGNPDPIGTPEEILAAGQKMYSELSPETKEFFDFMQENELFDVLGLPTFGLKRTKRGYYSTNAKVLADLAAEHEIVADVLEYRERSKIKSTYLDALPALVRGDGRIHTTLNQTVTATGRLSSSDPNLQNIPTRSELGHRVRQAFTVPEGSVFLACDYSQIELRLLAHLSGDEHLIAAFCEGRDFHAATAARVFGVPLDEVTPQLRSRAKAVNFGIVYGQQAFGLASSLKIPRAEAQEMIDRYFAAYPGVRAFLDESVRLAHERGWAETMYGRKRHIREFQQRNRQLVAFGERTAMNHPMQGTAADIIKIAMVRVERRLHEEGLASKLVLQIHDELDLEVPEAEVETVSALVRETMEGVVELKVPLVAEVSYGANWAEAK